MAVAENLRVTHSVRDEVNVVDGKVERVEGKVEDVGDKVEEIGDKVDDVCGKVDDVGDKVDDIGDRVEDICDKVQSADENFQVVIEGARHVRRPATDSYYHFYSEGKQAKFILQQTANNVDEMKCSSSSSHATARSSR